MIIFLSITSIHLQILEAGLCCSKPAKLQKSPPVPRLAWAVTGPNHPLKDTIASITSGKKMAKFRQAVTKKNVDQLSPEGYSLLSAAIVTASGTKAPEVFAHILDIGGDPNLIDATRESPIVYATRVGSVSGVRALANDSRTQLASLQAAFELAQERTRRRPVSGREHDITGEGMVGILDKAIKKRKGR